MIEKKPFNEIQTERLVLKPHQATFEYATKLYDLIKESYPFLTRFLNLLLKVTRPEDEYHFCLDCEKKWAAMEQADYGIWTKDGVLVGTCSFMDLDFAEHSAEIGYFLFEKYIRKGYMTETVKALENEFFSRGFNRIVIQMDIENTTSEKVAIRCGYTKEGVLRQWHYNESFNGFRDMCIYSKLKTEWENQK